jgi:hypothetical protein
MEIAEVRREEVRREEGGGRRAEGGGLSHWLHSLGIVSSLYSLSLIHLSLPTSDPPSFFPIFLSPTQD